MHNTTLTYKKTLKTTDKNYHKLFFGNKKSQNCLVVGRTPVKNLQNLQIFKQ